MTALDPLRAALHVHQKEECPLFSTLFPVQALDVAEKSFGPTDPMVATSLSRLGRFYKWQRKYSEAGPLYQRALAITEKSFEPDHRDMGMLAGSHWSFLFINVFD
jgi:hypothetical protein